jgi:hypothetical protein
MQLLILRQKESTMSVVLTDDAVPLKKTFVGPHYLHDIPDQGLDPHSRHIDHQTFGFVEKH